MLRVFGSSVVLSKGTAKVVSSGLHASSASRLSSRFVAPSANRRVFSVQTTARVPRPGNAVSSKWQSTVPWIGTVVVGCAWTMVVPTTSTTMSPTKCDVALETTVQTKDESWSITVRKTKKNQKSKWGKVKRALRMIRRILKLMIALSPIAALYPLQHLYAMVYPLPENDDDEKDAHQVALGHLANPVQIPEGPIGWYYRLCLHCIEWSGAAAIKIMQWAGSRPDMFGENFCAVFSQLQDDTTPHAWKHTEKALRDAYGHDWKDHIRLDKILGSGCIAQVYKGIVLDDAGNEQHVAVKVMHPNVEDDIEADLDIMRLSTHILERIPFDVTRDLKWLNLPGFVEEMANMLKIQLDLRTEADHLERFNKNFKNNDAILFPKLVEGYSPTKEVLIETFCEGQPIMDFIRNNTENQSVLHDMCTRAIQAVCQMIFLDNFIHGDLHPGNVLINKNKQFVLLDVGIVVENSDRDHRLISDVLAAFIRMDGRKAGRHMIDDSNARADGQEGRALNEEKFLDKIEKLTIEASGKNYLMEHLGTYITIICNAAAKHHVMLNPAFISAALAVKVQEGIALAMDPSIQIWRIAIPIILEGERRHGYIVDRAKESVGGRVGRFFDWMRGSTSTGKGDSTRVAAAS